MNARARLRGKTTALWPKLLGIAVCSCGGAAPSGGVATPADLVPPPAPRNEVTETPAQRGVCPLRVVPGGALGPVRLGRPTDTLPKETGLNVPSPTKFGRTEFFDVGPLRVRACDGKVTEVWLEDLRVGPNCVTVHDVALARDTPLSQVAARFSGCKELPARKGGSFLECEGGGLRLGYGMGEFLQIRVAERGSSIDDTCEAPPGTQAARTSTERRKLVARTLDQPAFAKYWHADKPGQSPLQFVWEEDEPPHRTMPTSL